MFRCDYCKSPVQPGKRLCKRQRCITMEIRRQTNEKCRELGMKPYYPQAPA